MEGQTVYLAGGFAFSTRDLAEAAVSLMAGAAGAFVHEMIVDECKDEAVRGLRLFRIEFGGGGYTELGVSHAGFGKLFSPNAPGPTEISPNGNCVHLSAKTAEEAALAAIEARSRFLASK